jgi:type II restriction/modification system DNA methylase subunit YeeA
MGIAFMGDTKGGAFDVDAELAEAMLASPNPNGRSNAFVVKPWANGLDLTRRPRDKWIIDFGVDMPIEEAALYEAPFEYIRREVMPARSKNRRAAYANRWWLHVEPRPAMRLELTGLERYIGTPRVAKHRVFAWLPKETLPDSQIIVFARDDDYFFGILHSKLHELWALRLGTQLETRPRYTPTTTFETFPFPEADVALREQIAEAAEALASLRDAWLNPSGQDSDPRRTMTSLYNRRPTWLSNAHDRLDRAVHAAYGWKYPLDPDDVLARLVALNLTRASKDAEVPLLSDALAERISLAKKPQAPATSR